jgi:hypothetical protein
MRRELAIWMTIDFTLAPPSRCDERFEDGAVDVLDFP